MTLFDGKPIEREECLIICDPCRIFNDHPHCKPVKETRVVKGKRSVKEIPCECPECHEVPEDEV